MSTRILAIILMLSGNFTFGQSPVFHLDFNENSGSRYVIEQISGISYSVNNSFDRPERMEANFGTALRLDGYSTFIKENDFPINDFDSAFTVELWFATEAFPKEPASFIECMSDEGGVNIQLRSYGRMNFTFFFNGIKRILTPNKYLSKYKWHHIVFAVDGVNGEANIVVDGEIWLTHNFTKNAELNSSENTLFIGKGRLNEVFAGFSLNTLNGAIDELKVYPYALSTEEILENFSQADQIDVELAIDPSIRHEGDYLRPQFHPMPNTSWTNECYGLLYHEGKYHLFFQKNPNGPYLYFMHWGHLSSPDLVNWKEERIAMAPSFGFDNFGVWSGTTITNPEGEVALIYTGVDGAKAGIGMAVPKDTNLISWEEIPGNPLISSPPQGYAHKDFRDPFVFQKDGQYYMIVGSGIANDGGGILFSYKSNDLITWELIAPIWQSTDVENHGIFWEMPSMFAIDEENYIVQVTPQFKEKPANSLYWIGSFIDEKFIPHFELAKQLEEISEFLLAPAFGQDEAGRWTYIGIIPEDRNVNLQVEAGWRHVFSMPRVIRLLADGNTIGQQPHPNLCRARKNHIGINNKTIQAGSTDNLADYNGIQSELHFKLHAPQNELFKIQVFKNDSGSEYTSIIFDKNKSRVGIDKQHSSPYSTVKDTRFQTYNFNPNDSIDVRLFLDHSVLEVFVDNLIAMSTRVYPSEGSNHVDLLVENAGIVHIESYNAWDIVQKEELSEPQVCEIDRLPVDLFTSIFSINTYENSDWNIYPNPAQEYFYLNNNYNDEIKQKLEIKIFSFEGKNVLSTNVELNNKINIGHLAKGYYLIYISSQEKQSVIPFIKT